MNDLSSPAQAVDDMPHERRKDFDAFAVGWAVGAARQGKPWAVEFLAEVVPSFEETVPWPS